MQAIIVYCLLLFISSLMDLYDYYELFSGMIALGGSSLLQYGSPWDALRSIFSALDPGVEDVIMEVFIFGTFVWMISSIKKFARAQEDLQTQLSLEKVGSALWLNFAASVVNMLPIPVLSGLAALIMYIVSYSMMASSFRFLMFSPVFDAYAHSAAGTLKSYAIWSIWGLVPLIGWFCRIAAWIQYIRGWSKMCDGNPVSAPAFGGQPIGGVVVNVGSHAETEVQVTDEHLNKARSKTDEELKELLKHKEDYNPQLVKAAEQVLLERVMGHKEQVAKSNHADYMPLPRETEKQPVQTVEAISSVEKKEEALPPAEKPVVDTRKEEPATGVQPYGNPTGTSGKGNTKMIVAVAVAVLVLAGGLLGYFLWYVPYAKDRDALRTYVLANNVFLRSSQMAGVEYNILDKLPYGSELITYEKSAEWASVKVKGMVGYVASLYLLVQADFVLLNGVWGDVDSKECIESSKCRLAILDFYKKNGLASGSGGWQVYTKAKNQKPNTVFYPRIYNKNSKFTDFVFIVKDNASGKRMVVGYSFDDETERPIFRFKSDAPTEGYIKNVSASYNTLKVEFDDNYKVELPLY